MNPLYQAWALFAASLLLVYASDGVTYMILMKLFFATCIFWLLVSMENAKLFQDPKGSQSANKRMAVYEIQSLTITTINPLLVIFTELVERSLCTTNYVMFSFLLVLASATDYINFISNIVFSGDCREVHQLLCVDHIIDRYFGSIITQQIGIYQEFNDTLAKKVTNLLLISCIQLEEFFCTINYVNHYCYF